MSPENSVQWTEPSTWPWIVCIWLVMFAAGWVKPLWRWVQRNRAAGWPFVSGQIESASVSEVKPSFFSSSRRGGSPKLVAELKYSYPVGGSAEAGICRRNLTPSEKHPSSRLDSCRDSRKPAGRPHKPQNFWKVILKGSPNWVRYPIYGFFGYAVINFIYFFYETKDGRDGGDNPAAMVWRGFSGHWMVFYLAAFTILYTAEKRRTGSNRCVRGHRVGIGANFCPRCGQPAIRQ
jgi:hypothetical protein